MEGVVNKQDTIDVLIASLDRLGPMDRSDRDLLRNLGLRTRSFVGAEEIVKAGSRPAESCCVVDGFAARAQQLADGGRQLDQIHVAGDFVDLHSLHLRHMDHSVIAIGPCNVAYVQHGEIVAAMASSHRLTWIFWQLAVLDGAVARTWMSCLGRRRAQAALAHLVCELFTRLARSGDVAGDRFHFPATQADVADMLGITTVHLNRTLAELRARRLLFWSNREVKVPDFEKLAEVAYFDDGYLEPGRPMPVGFGASCPGRNG